MSNSKVSITIPVYNAEQDLQSCLDSIYNQTYNNYEIIAVNDGSTDRSYEILQTNTSNHHNLQILNQKNHGQGYARNRAVEKARGEYILFLDADDHLEVTALEKLVGAADRNAADIVHCGWRAGQTGSTAHQNVYQPSNIFNVSSLSGEACDQLLRLHDYFSVNNLYRRRFLVDRHIEFGEGYIYEDNEFIVAAATRADKIVFIDEPLYVVNFHGASSTRGTNTTDKHYRDFLTAVDKSFAALHARTPESKAYLANYMLEKFIIYYRQRIPKEYRRQYVHDFIDSMSKQNITLAPYAGISKFLRLCICLRVFERRRYRLFGWCIFYKTTVAPLVRR